MHACVIQKLCLLDIEIFCNVFTLTFYQIHASLLNKSINFGNTLFKGEVVACNYVITIVRTVNYALLQVNNSKPNPNSNSNSIIST